MRIVYLPEVGVTQGDFEASGTGGIPYVDKVPESTFQPELLNEEVHGLQAISAGQRTDIISHREVIFGHIRGCSIVPRCMLSEML